MRDEQSIRADEIKYQGVKQGWSRRKIRAESYLSRMNTLLLVQGVASYNFTAKTIPTHSNNK